MAYLEAFIYYIAVVLFIYLITFGVFVLFYMLYEQFKLSYLHGDVTGELNKEYFDKLLKHKLFKFLVLAYFATFTFFYINQASDYFSEKRAYPQAKAYKIVADLVLFHYDFFISNRNLYYKPSGLKYINTYQKVQNYLMQKGFEYIPKDDAERAIWKYEYFYSQYIRAMAAPIDFKKLHKSDLGYILRIGGHPTIYKPQAKQMLIEVESLLDSLMDKPMKDKYYDEVNRYTTTILFSEWWQKFSFLHYSLGVRTVDEEMSTKFQNIIMRWTDDKAYLKKLAELSHWLDITKEKIDRSKELQKEMKRHKLLYPDLMGLRVWYASKIAYSDLLNKQFSCDLQSLKRYATIRKKTLEYLKNTKSFNQLTKQEHRYPDGIIDYGFNGVITYVLHNVCGIKKNDLKYSKDIKETWDTSKIMLEKTKKIIEGFKNGR